MKNAELSFNPGIPNPKKEESDNPEQIRQKRRLDQLEKQKKRLDQQVQRLKKVLAKKIASKFLLSQDNPNDDPGYLWTQIRPIIGRMGIANLCQNNKTQLVIGKTQRDNSLYQILFRRQTKIDPDIISRFKREEKSIDHIIWSNDGIIIYVWAPYVAPAVAP